MLVFLFLILYYSFPSGIPPYSILFVCSELYSYQINQFEQYINLLNNNKKKACKAMNEYEFRSEYCVKSLENLTSARFSNGNDINEKLQKLSKYGEFLFIFLEGTCNTIYFNKLKTDHVVYISNETDLYIKHSINQFGQNDLSGFLLDTFKSIQKITKKSNIEESKPFHNIGNEIIETEKNVVADDDEFEYRTSPILINVSIEGDIKKKVSYLTISGIRLNVINNNLNIHSIYLFDSEIDLNSKDITTTFFTTDKNTQDRHIGYIYPKIHVEQYGIMLLDYSSSHEIVFFDECWGIRSSNNYKWYMLVYYYMAKSFNWIVKGQFFYLLHNGTIREKRLLNISIINNALRTTLDNDITEIELIASGDWSVIDNKPIISINYDPLYYRLRQNDEINRMFSIDQPKLPYSYVPLNKRKKHQSKMGILCGIIYVLLLSIILIIIAIYYTPRKVSFSEDEESNSDKNDNIRIEPDDDYI